MSWKIVMVATLLAGITSAIPIAFAPSFVTPRIISPTVLSCAPVLEILEPLPCNRQLVLPPYGVELPLGLGYLPAAAPIVATAFGECCYGPCSAVSAACVTGCQCADCCSPAVPIVSSCSCAALATPVCPNIRSLVKPILL